MQSVRLTNRCFSASIAAWVSLAFVNFATFSVSLILVSPVSEKLVSERDFEVNLHLVLERQVLVRFASIAGCYL